MSVRQALDWLRGRKPAPDALDDPDPPAAFAAWLRGRDAVRDKAAGRPKCARCGACRSEDDAILRRDWCAACELEWLEDNVVWPLAMRLGRKGARRALRALVRGEIGPQSK